MIDTSALVDAERLVPPDTMTDDAWAPLHFRAIEGLRVETLRST